MKKILLMGVWCWLLAGLSSCSSDEYDSDFVEPENDAPEFAEGKGLNPRYYSQLIVTNEDGVEYTKDFQGNIRVIHFADNGKAPTSAEKLFSKYLGYNINKDFRRYREETYDKTENPIRTECYQQQYKGVIIYQAGFNVRFKDGKVTDGNGTCIRINDLDVTPSFSFQKAKEIYAKYLNVPVENIGTGGILAWFDDELMIAEFPVSKGSTEWAPRLVYALNCDARPDEGFCFLDAHTGRILETWCTYIF